MLTDLISFSIDKYFRKLGDIDRGRLRISKFQTKLGWILSCDHWPYLGGLLNIKVRLGSEQQGWKLFCSMLDKFVEKMDYARWFSDNSLKIRPPILSRKLSYVEMEKSSLSSWMQMGVHNKM